MLKKLPTSLSQKRNLSLHPSKETILLTNSAVFGFEKRLYKLRSFLLQKNFSYLLHLQIQNLMSDTRVLNALEIENDLFASRIAFVSKFINYFSYDFILLKNWS